MINKSALDEMKILLTFRKGDMFMSPLGIKRPNLFQGFNPYSMRLD